MAITIDDFSKIWASTSPLTPYEFSESQYKDGWNFIGGTPPSRQMWDFLQKNNDEKSQYLLNNFDNYLPLSGGTLTGEIKGTSLTLTAESGGNSASLVLGSMGSATWNGNNILTDKYETADISMSPIGSGKAYFYKVGRMCIAKFDPVSNMAASSAFTVSASIPQGFRPITDVIFSYWATANLHWSFTLQSNGTFSGYNYGNAVTGTLNNYFYMMYITAD